MEKRVDAGYDADHTAVCWGGLCSRYARSWPLLECFSGRAWRVALEIGCIPGATCSAMLAAQLVQFWSNDGESCNRSLFQCGRLAQLVRAPAQQVYPSGLPRRRFL